MCLQDKQGIEVCRLVCVEGDLVEGGVIDRYLEMAEDQGERAILGALSMNPNTGKIGMMTRLRESRETLQQILQGQQLIGVDHYMTVCIQLTVTTS